MKYVAWSLAGLLLVVGLGWFAAANQLAMFKVFNPAYQQAQRETFEQSKSYRQGMVQELQNMQFEYEQASPEHKAALRRIILQRAADFPDDDMTPALASFVNKLRRGE